MLRALELRSETTTPEQPLTADVRIVELAARMTFADIIHCSDESAARGVPERLRARATGRLPP